MTPRPTCETGGLNGEASSPVVIAARSAPTGPGGLAAYQRGLAREIARRTGTGPTLCAYSGEAPPPPRTTLLNSMVQEPRRIWMSLASRPYFHSVLECWIRSVYRRGLDHLLPKNPRAVHFVGTGWDFSGFAMADFARRKRIPFSIWPAVHPHQWGDDKIDLRLYKQADRVFCQSAGEVEHLTALGLERTKTIRCGLPPLCLPAGDGARLRHQLGIGTRPAVLFLGRRSRDKGYGILLQAWKSVLTTFPDAVLILAGPWADGERIENPDDSIRDLGTPDEETKADALAACDLFALPSAYESFGIVYVEAWSYGKPVICGTAPASRELIENGVTGLWVEQTPEAVSQAIIRLLGDSALRSSLGAEGRNLQLEKFTWDATAAAHEAAWQAAGSFTSSKP